METTDANHPKDSSSRTTTSSFQWSLFRLQHDANKNRNVQNNNNNHNHDAPQADVLEISNPHVPLSSNTHHGIQLIPNFCSDTDIQSVLQDLEHERSSWEGFQQRRRVYRYNLKDGNQHHANTTTTNITSLPSSLQAILDRFETQFTTLRPQHVVVEDYPPVHGMRINSSQKIFTTFESPTVCPICSAPTTKELEDSPITSSYFCSSGGGGCFVAQITLVPDAGAVEHWNQPQRRDPQCYQLVSSLHWTDVRLPKGSLLIKTQDSLWQWRTSIVASGIPPSFANTTTTTTTTSTAAAIDQPLPRIVILKLYRLASPVADAFTTTNSLTIAKADDHDLNSETNNSNNNGNLESTTKPDGEKVVFGYIPSPRDFIPPPNAVMPDMRELLTIVITTSPIRSHPSIELLERTMSTFALAGPEFMQCQKVIVCDGVRLREDEDKNDSNNNNNNHNKNDMITKRHHNVKQAMRNGIVTPTQMEHYHQFKQNLKHACEVADADSLFGHTQVVELDTRHGYGFALRHALTHCVSTRFVCVIQHDRTFMRPTPMYQALHSMWRHANIKYIGMSMRSNLLYRDLFRSKYGPDAATELGKLILRPPELVVDAKLYGPDSQSFQHMLHADDLSDQVRDSNQTLLETYHAHAQRWAEVDSKKYINSPGQHQMILMPTLYWYDNTHLAETAHYRDFIYDPRYKMVARGGFVEDKLSPVLVKTVERFGLAEGHARFGCFLLDDCSGLFFTGHLDGGSYLTDEQRQAMQAQNQQQRENKD
jgi:hypothetical protein